MALVTCAKCEGWGQVVFSWDRHYHAVTGQEVTTKRWYNCPVCKGAGTLEVKPRAEVWKRVASAGIELIPELREEGDLGYAGESGEALDGSGDVASRPS